MATPHQPDPRVLQWMRENGVPLTREAYIDLAWGASAPVPWTVDDEAELPADLQDWTRFKPDEQPGD